MSERKKIYWDSSCFICLLNKSSEADRMAACTDVMRHAQGGEFDIVTSTWTIVEVIRPKKKLGDVPALPEWSELAFEAVPQCQGQVRRLWDYFHRNTNAPSQKLTEVQIAAIDAMFSWPCIKLAYLDQRIASRAVELARDHELKPPDAVHAATAILNKVSELQRWDRDFNRVADLVRVAEPTIITQQQDLIEGFKKPLLAIPADAES